ncbi:MAG: alpha/beta hydrolase [Bacillota bacterium]|nr:alpha/beta hydrolase [Bacillota bacterium]
MNIKLKDMNIHYDVSGKGKNVIILHGWGASSAVMQPIVNGLEGKMRVFNLDLPGFGKSDEPLSGDWNIYSYADFVKDFATALEIDNPVIIAHSYGGRIALILAGKKMMKINKMVLTGCAGILPKRGISYYTKVYSYKIMKKISRLTGSFFKKQKEKMKKKYGSEDYRNASEKMRAVMVRAINEDLKYLLPHISVSTLLIWGEDDEATPLSDGKIMEKFIPDAGLVVMPGSGHFAFLQQSVWFNNIVKKFLEKDMEEN